MTDFVSGSDFFEINANAFGFQSNNGLVEGTDFFSGVSAQNFDGSADLAADGYIVFDTVNNKLIAADGGEPGYTVLGTITGDSVTAADIDIINFSPTG